MPDGSTWTIKDFGPLYIPRAGDIIDLSPKNILLYGKLMEYETGRIHDTASEQYTFMENYCFLAGDNVLNSNDSRYFGLVPEKYIVGVVVGKDS